MCALLLVLFLFLSLVFRDTVRLDVYRLVLLIRHHSVTASHIILSIFITLILSLATFSHLIVAWLVVLHCLLTLTFHPFCVFSSRFSCSCFVCFLSIERSDSLLLSACFSRHFSSRRKHRCLVNSYSSLSIDDSMRLGLSVSFRLFSSFLLVTYASCIYIFLFLVRQR
jgi:hypothetical protein